MIDNYLRQIETFISPKNYKPDINDKNIQNIQINEDVPPQLSAENRKKIEEYLKSQMLEGKGKLYDRILDSTSQNSNNLSASYNYNRNTTQHTSSHTQNYHSEKLGPHPSNVSNITRFTNLNATNQGNSNNIRKKSQSPSKNIDNSDISNDLIAYQKKIHDMNIKSMNYRYEITKLQQTIDSQQKTIMMKDTIIQKLEKQRDNDAKYLLKLEAMLSQKAKPEIPINPIHNTNLQDFTSSKQQENLTQGSKTDEELKTLELNFNDKKEVKEFILKSMREIKLLKEFQQSVYEISQNYDSINDNIIEGMNLIQQLINNVNQYQRLDNVQFQQLTGNFEKIADNIQKTLEVKQLEYNLLIKSKENEIAFLNEEFIKANKKMEFIRQDRMQDQKLINDLQTQNVFLNMRITEIIEGSVGSRANEQNSKSRQSRPQTQQQRKSNPMKESVEKMVRNFEKNLDMKDRGNVNFIENINYRLKY